MRNDNEIKKECWSAAIFLFEIRIVCVFSIFRCVSGSACSSSFLRLYITLPIFRGRGKQLQYFSDLKPQKIHRETRAKSVISLTLKKKLNLIWIFRHKFQDYQNWHRPPLQNVIDSFLILFPKKPRIFLHIPFLRPPEILPGTKTSSIKMKFMQN